MNLKHDWPGHPERIDMPGQSVLLLIPAYQACDSLRELIPALQKDWSGNILIVDDGSDDQTESLVLSLGERCLRNTINRGKGAALWVGMQTAAQSDAEWIVCMDADGQHQPEDVRELLRHTENEKFLMGNRMANAETMPFIRRVVNKVMSGCISRRLKTVIPDTQYGLRVYHRSVLPEHEPAYKRFAFDTEELFRLVRQGVLPKSVPVACRYNGNESHIHSIRDTIQFFKLMRDQTFSVKSSGVLNESAD